MIREPDVAAPLPNEPSRYTFNHQLAAVGLLLVLLISVPAMINALIAQARPRATPYALFILGSVSPVGRALFVPVRHILASGRTLRLRPPGGIGDRADHPDGFHHRHVPVLLGRLLAARGTMYLLICWAACRRPGAS